MKTSDEFTSIAELEAIASDKSVEVPSGLREDVSLTINALSFLDEEEPVIKRRNFTRIAGIAASAAILLGIGFGIGHAANSPKDTFTDPYLAYAQLEETFSMISDKMDKGLTMASEAGNMISKTNEIMNKIN